MKVRLRGEAGLEFVDESIVVAADVQAIYACWLDYEGYPRFMRGIDDVSVAGYCRLRWTGRVCGRTERWETDVVARVEDTRLRWHACDGRETGEVSFEKLDAGSTLVHYQLQYDPVPWAVDEDGLRACLQARVCGDLERFRELSESCA